MGGIHIGGSLGKVLGNVGNTVKKAVTDTGHAVGKVADNPWVQGATAAALAATGAGAPAAAAILAAERGGGKLLKPGGNIGEGLRGGVEGAALGAGAAKLGNVARGVLSAPGGIAGALKSGASNLGKMAMSKLVPGAGGDGGGGFLDSATDFLKDNALPLGVGLLGAKQVGDERNAADALTNRGIASAHDAYDAKAPLRKMALSQLMSDQTPNLSGRFDTGATNPYAKKVAMSSLVPNAAPAPGGSPSASGIASNLLRASDVGGASNGAAMANRLSLSSLNKPSPSLAIGSRVPAKFLTSGAY